MQILMPQIRVRKPFAGTCVQASSRSLTYIQHPANNTFTTAAFIALCLIAAYLGLTPNQIPQYGQSDKGLHFVTFFLLTVSPVHSLSASLASGQTLITCASTVNPSRYETAPPQIVCTSQQQTNSSNNPKPSPSLINPLSSHSTSPSTSPAAASSTSPSSSSPAC